MILLLDNYDSFTYNLYQYLSELGQDVKVIRNDRIDIEKIYELDPERIIISPGPGWDICRGCKGVFSNKTFIGSLFRTSMCGYSIWL